MLRGYYTAAAGMIAQQRRQETLSNNMANALTPGYKQDQATLRAFPELLIERMESKKLPTSTNMNIPMQTRIGSINTGVYVQETIPDFTQGSLKETGVSTDMAIVNGTIADPEGNLFFTIQNQDGEERYTRNGNFTVDGQGFLVSNHGHYVLDQAGNPIATGGLEFNLTAEGMIQLGNQNIPLGVAYSQNANNLVKEGQDLFRLAEGEQALLDARVNPGTTFTIQQKFLENSNVDANQTMTDMMQAYRSFEMNQNVLKAYDQSMDKAVNEIARLR
ncbi:flagellar hook-basal body complex protein [Aquibacillus halophilus]|uniref:Flagellar hook-basal body complex protein n=1 Tax=Aquibacillus halophilus TaxID=930132 RepID=A0A6A8DLS6_9BACI|nr:flagellar hook-basal body protein [Aquibacillus halophilus]MRH43947.1 flagellar hook-basal body complex protein [Aquibacillus halophilus]